MTEETDNSNDQSASRCYAVGNLNLNTYVRFKMKPRGVEIARRYWTSSGLNEFPNVLYPVDVPDVECRVQFHELFRIFGGDHMRHDMEGCPFYDLIVEPMPAPGLPEKEDQPSGESRCSQDYRPGAIRKVVLRLILPAALTVLAIIYGIGFILSLDGWWVLPTSVVLMLAGLIVSVFLMGCIDRLWKMLESQDKS